VGASRTLTSMKAVPLDTGHRMIPIKRIALLLLASLTLFSADAGIVTQSGSRYAAPSGGGGGSGTAFFSDDFESVTVGSGIAGRGTAAFSFETANNATLSVIGSNSFANSGTKALKFDYKARPNTFNCEQPFLLSQEYQELWIGFKLYIPSNYSNTGTDAGGTTNKKFFALYNSVDGYSTSNMSIYEYEQDGSGGGIINFTFKEKDSGSPNDTVHVPTTGSFIDGVTDLGQWITVALHVKAATNPRSGTYPNITSNGVMEIWKNRVLWASSTTIGNNAVSGRGFDTGYIMGAPNGGFPVDTAIHIDDIVFADNQAAIAAYLP
jgi:hypothetical protein